MPAECPTDAELTAFRLGALEGEPFERVAAHLESGCEVCTTALAASQHAIDPLARAVRGPAVGSQVGLILGGRYRLIEPIGEGGMGQVFLAQQTEPVRRTVAVKLIRPGMDSSAILARFEAERQALALMDHPNIARVFDAGSTPDGRPYFVMELVKGVPVTRFCDERQLGVTERLRLFTAVCHAVQHAHQKGVIHRDIKPGNVLVTTYDGVATPKVIDFGVAKAAGSPLTDRSIVTEFAAVVGTLEYMAPEQAGEAAVDVDTRADVYALGVLLYELLTGTTPIDRKRLREAGLLEMLRLVREEEPPAPSTRLSSSDALPSLAAVRGSEPRTLTRLLKGELDWIVMKALEKDRDRRYGTSAALAADVARFLADEMVEARPPTAGYRLRKFIRRNRGAVLVAVFALFGVAAFVSALAGQLRVARDAEASALKAQAEAETARGQEAAQRMQTQSALAQAKQELENRELVQNFFLQNVIAAGRPADGRTGLGKDVTLRRAIDAAVPKIGPLFAGRPVVEAVIRAGLGDTYYFLGEFPASREQFETARGLRQTVLGPDHADTLAAISGIARAAMMMGNNIEAIDLYVRAYQGSLRTFGDAAVETVKALNSVALARLNAEQFTEAGVLLDKVVPALREKLGPDDPATLSALANLAEVYARDKTHPEFETRRVKAVDFLRSIRDARVAKLGAKNPATLTAAHNHGAALAGIGQLKEALAVFTTVAADREEVLGPTHVDTLISKKALDIVTKRLAEKK